MYLFRDIYDIIMMMRFDKLINYLFNYDVPSKLGLHAFTQMEALRNMGQSPLIPSQVGLAHNPPTPLPPIRSHSFAYILQKIEIFRIKSVQFATN